MKLRLKELRKENGYTQQFVAEKLNIKQNTYSMYENGLHEIPIECLTILSEFYNTSVDFILGLTDYDFPYPRNK